MSIKPNVRLHWICFNHILCETINRVFDGQRDGFVISVQYYNNCRVVRSGKSCHFESCAGGRVVDLNTDPMGVRRQEFAKVTQSVEKGLFVVLSTCFVNYYGGVNVVAHPIGAALCVQNQVPVGPTACPVIEILIDVRNRLISFFFFLIYYSINW